MDLNDSMCDLWGYCHSISFKVTLQSCDVLLGSLKPLFILTFDFDMTHATTLHYTCPEKNATSLFWQSWIVDFGVWPSREQSLFWLETNKLMIRKWTGITMINNSSPLQMYLKMWKSPFTNLDIETQFMSTWPYIEGYLQRTCNYWMGEIHSYFTTYTLN